MDPQQEAISILREAIADLTSPDRDLTSIMRRCQHACEILGWEPAKAWFHQELNGYYPDTVLPPHRKIQGSRKWEFEGPLYEGIMYRSDESMHGLDPKVYDEEADVLEVRAGLSWFVSGAQHGYREPLSEKKKAPSPSGRDQVTLRRVRSFSAGSIAYSLSQIEKHVFDWVSASYVQLQYGNQVKDIWERRRAVVDAAIQNLGLANHLSAIQDGITRDNPESWRSAVFECRSLLNDVANHLWQDARDTYDYLPGSASNGKLDVRKDKFSNRLSAYLHQKSVTGTTGRFLRDEAERLSVSIRSLVAADSEAHSPIERPLAETVVLSTYFIIGELALRTDLEPITQYGPAAA
jgi:hypothetical protein